MSEMIYLLHEQISDWPEKDHVVGAFTSRENADQGALCFPTTRTWIEEVPADQLRGPGGAWRSTKEAVRAQIIRQAYTNRVDPLQWIQSICNPREHEVTFDDKTGTVTVSCPGVTDDEAQEMIKVLSVGTALMVNGVRVFYKETAA